MILDAGNLKGLMISNPFKAKVGSCSIHEIQFNEKTAEIIQSSGISHPQKYTKQKLEKHRMNLLEIFVAYSYTYQKVNIFV